MRENFVLKFINSTMAHSYINWTRAYNLFHVNGNFNIYVSSHKSGHFYGAVFYYVQNKNRTDKTSIPEFEFKLQQFVDLTEDGVYKQCTKWVDENLNGEYKVTVRETLTF